MTSPADRLQDHLGDGVKLGPEAQRQANEDPGRAAALALFADVYGLKSGGGFGAFGLGTPFFKAAWEGDQTTTTTTTTDDQGQPVTDDQSQPVSPGPTDELGSMFRGAIATILDFSSPIYPETDPRNPAPKE